jgi:hypothetical protein
MTGLDRAAAADALAGAYGKITQFAGGLTEAAAMLPSRCAGWAVLVRQVLHQLAGSPLPASWDDVTCALKGTGRQPVSQADQSALGPAAGRLPLFG